MMEAILLSRGDTDFVFEPPPVAQMRDLCAAFLFVVIFKSLHFQCPFLQHILLLCCCYVELIFHIWFKDV